MIAKLSGIVDQVGEDYLVIDVGGVGYKVFATGRMLGALPARGAEVVLQIEPHIREDHFHLYGFEDPAEADMFRLLQNVQGVGARVAMGILSVLDPEALSSAVTMGDTAAIAQASGVGPKLAQRIANEMADKIGRIPAAGAGATGLRTAAAGTPGGDAVSALVKLGYRAADAQRAIAAAQRAAGEEADVAALIRQGLKELSQ